MGKNTFLIYDLRAQASLGDAHFLRHVYILITKMMRLDHCRIAVVPQ
jgi:hypothetical protein